MSYICTTTDNKPLVLFGTLAPTKSLSEHLAKVRYGLNDVLVYTESEIARAWELVK
jgi:hypothetical protein